MGKENEYAEDAKLFAEIFAAIAADDDDRFDEASRKIEERISELEAKQNEPKDPLISEKILQKIGDKALYLVGYADTPETLFCYARIAKIIDECGM